MKVSVIIPMHNFNSMTDDCIKHCKENAGIEHNILVVDDGSAIPYVNENAEVLRFDKNCGFTKAINAGLKHLNYDYDYVCLLNNDTKPLPDFLLNLVTTAQKNPEAGIIGAGRVESGEEYTVLGWQLDLTNGTTITFSEDLPETVPCISIPFCCVLLSKKCIQHIGLLDERMINYSSDTDYCLRAVLMDFYVLFEPKAKVFHYRNVTCLKDNINNNKDVRSFSAKWFGVAQNEIFKAIAIHYEYKKYGRIKFEYETKQEAVMV